MTKRKKKKNGFFLVGMIILGLLCLVFIAGDVYLFVLAQDAAQEADTTESTETALSAQTESPAVSELPQIIVAAQPEVSQETQPEETSSEEPAVQEPEIADWQNDWVSFSYETSAMWVTEDNGVIVVTDPQLTDLPRMDVQQLAGTEELTQAEFEILARAAVRAYFSAEPSADVVSVSAVTESAGGWTAELTVAATDVSPALNAWVRLTNDILVSMLLPQTADKETQAVWVDTLESVTG